MTFIAALTTELVHTYSEAVVSTWEFRVGTEPNCLCHWQDDSIAWAKMYDFATAGVKSVLPKARVGPGNFCFFNPPGCRNMTFVGPILDHFRNGTNYATGRRGSPVDFIGLSAYSGGKAGMCVPPSPIADILACLHRL